MLILAASTPSRGHSSPLMESHLPTILKHSKEHFTTFLPGVKLQKVKPLCFVVPYSKWWRDKGLRKCTHSESETFSSAQLEYILILRKVLRYLWRTFSYETCRLLVLSLSETGGNLYKARYLRPSHSASLVNVSAMARMHISSSLV